MPLSFSLWHVTPLLVHGGNGLLRDGGRMPGLSAHGLGLPAGGTFTLSCASLLHAGTADVTSVLRD